MIQRLFIILRESLSAPFLSFIVVLAIAASVTIAGLFHITGENFNQYINKRFASSIPPNTIKVSPREGKRVLFFTMKDSSVKRLDNRALRQMRRLRGVRDIVPFMTLKIPMQARISMLGLRYRSDVMSIGVPRRFLGKDIPRRFRRTWRMPKVEEPVPVILPRPILSIYNEGMAEANGLPKLSEASVRGLSFDLLFGRSSLKTLEDFSRTTAVIAGMTDRINNLAIIVPFRTARYYNKKYISGYRPEYMALFVKVSDHASLLRVSSTIRKMGFRVEVEKGLSRQILDLKKRVGRVVDTLMLLVIIISSVAVAFSTMIATMDRLDYYRIMRIVGASRPFISLSIIFKYMVLGAAGTFAGIMILNGAFEQIAALVPRAFAGIKPGFDEALIKKIFFWGTILPVVSTIPALFRLYLRALNRD